MIWVDQGPKVRANISGDLLLPSDYQAGLLQAMYSPDPDTRLQKGLHLDSHIFDQTTFLATTTNHKGIRVDNETLKLEGIGLLPGHFQV
jgi:hypothetical protein